MYILRIPLVGVFMICPKCGDKYEDDMPCCLWCDAPNPYYGKEKPPSAPKKVSVIKRNIREIESDSEVFYDGAVFELGGAKHVLNIMGIFLLLGFGLFYCITLSCGVYDDFPTPIYVIFLGVSVLSFFLAFLLSKKVLKVIWFNDKFVLCTRYGEKEVRFDELERNNVNVDQYNRRFFFFKKNGKSFQVFENDYPNVVQKLCNILDKLAEKNVMQVNEGPEYVVYKPVLKVEGGSPIGFIAAVLFAFVVPWENALYLTCYFACLFGYFWVVYEGVKAVLEIRWYSDKFVLCTHFGDMTFWFENSTPLKIKYDKNGNCRFIFKDGRLSFDVNERYFPEVVEKLKERYENR